MKMTVDSSTSSSRTPPPSTSTPYNNIIQGDDDSCYYPGCRKDANCHCNICLDSFNSTRDLILNHSSILLTTTTTTTTTKKKKKSKGLFWEMTPCKLVFLLAVPMLIWAMDSGFLMSVSEYDGPKLTSDTVRGFLEEEEEGRAMEGDFKMKLGILQRKVEGVVGIGKVSNCTCKDSLWKLNQEGDQFIFLWRCVMYQSMREELSVWGSPLLTSGLLVAGLSSRSITLLSGTITEWSEERRLMPMTTRRSWTLEKWSSAAVQLEKETWVLEHRRTALFQGTGLIQSTREIFMRSLQDIVRKLKSKDGSRLKNPT